MFIHGFALIVFSSHFKFQKISAQTLENQEAIRVETVNLPPPSSANPPESPPPTRAPLLQAPPSSEPEPLVRRKPNPTPTPTSQPSPSSLPTPSPTPETSTSAKPQATPSPLLTASPSISPSPQPTPTYLADLPPAEAQAKKSIQDFMKIQGVEVPEELPQGFKTWQEYQSFLLSFDENAKKLMTLPEHTSGSDQAGNSSAASSSPNNQQKPSDQEGLRRGARLLDFLLGQQESGANQQNFDTSDTENKLNIGQQRLRELTGELVLPTPSSALPLPEKWETGSLGFSYVRFTYDQLRFQVRWDDAVQEQVREVYVNHYPATNPKAIQSFKLKWNPDWGQDIKKLISAVLMVYEQKKKEAASPS